MRNFGEQKWEIFSERQHQVATSITIFSNPLQRLVTKGISVIESREFTVILSNGKGEPIMRPVTEGLKLVGNVIAHPTMIGTLASIGFNPLKSSWDAGEPWWNPRAIRYLHERVTDGAKVFEWGSGASTVWLDSLGLSVVSIESDARWAEKVQAALPNVTIKLIPGEEHGNIPNHDQLRETPLTTYFDHYVSAIDEYPDDYFDVVIIDGMARDSCAQRCRTKVRRGGTVVIEDTHWHVFNECCKSLWDFEVTRFRGFKRRSAEINETTFLTRL